jgi:ribosome modulation factor
MRLGVGEIMSIDSSQEAWEQGFAAGLLGVDECPYFAGTDEALTWLSAWIEGERIRLVQLARHTQPNVVRRVDLASTVIFDHHACRPEEASRSA